MPSEVAFGLIVCKWNLGVMEEPKHLAPMVARTHGKVVPDAVLLSPRYTMAGGGCGPWKVSTLATIRSHWIPDPALEQLVVWGIRFMKGIEAPRTGCAQAKVSANREVAGLGGMFRDQVPILKWKTSATDGHRARMAIKKSICKSVRKGSGNRAETAIFRALKGRLIAGKSPGKNQRPRMVISTVGPAQQQHFGNGQPYPHRRGRGRSGCPPIRTEMNINSATNG